MTVNYIAFRTDATSQIGTGHFMRCLTLAEALKKQGAQIRFVCRGLPTHLRDMLAAKSMQFASLDSEPVAPVDGDLAHAQWLGTSQADDAQATIQALADRHWDWIVVDHYALDARWESALRASTKQIMVIDDIADRQHDCDVLLDQNYYADMRSRYEGKVPAHCQQLLGPRFALLREEFRKLREHAKPRTGSVKKILVFFGGVDADNYTSLAIQALAAIGNKALHIDVVIGAQHPYREQIQQACVEQGYVCHVQTTRIAELMAAADMAIGAGGSANWERCAMGLPSLIMVLAENQNKAAIDLAATGVLINLGDARLIMKTDLIRAIDKLLVDEQLRTELSNASLRLVPMSEQSELAEIMNGNYV